MSDASIMEDDLSAIRKVAMEELPKVVTSWMRGAAEALSEVASKALDDQIDEKEWKQWLKIWLSNNQDLSAKMDSDVLADWLERSMGTAAASGVVRSQEKQLK